MSTGSVTPTAVAASSTCLYRRRRQRQRRADVYRHHSCAGGASATHASRRTGTTPRALPPANEIAGFVVGAALVGLCVGGARLDGLIARAQVAAMKDAGEAKRFGERAGKGGGSVFTIPEDDEDEDEGGVGAQK
jgi:hypothetical protein